MGDMYTERQASMDVVRICTVINGLPNTNPHSRDAILHSFEATVMHLMDRVEQGAYMRVVIKELIDDGSTDNQGEGGQPNDTGLHDPENDVRPQSGNGDDQP